ncbi:MAG: bifunctional phosphoribosylaminoimidazolecarboxamide formyltransferase/IMP cyclohydrolase [Tenuifilaceae bacterium]|jgi:phosphoribosylaminoimidazolecarboxamide formyltransferase/IMP cyclohydrolase|nr:bifunctional phosphoribosylaminoimidazolecarboxamide formyltransferase/IMP cyclohydrolase [Tenuifilaceae bacterium]
MKPIKTALISVYHKDGLDDIVHLLNKYGTKIYSTGGTLKYIEDCGVAVEAVESLTTYPSILGGRVKTLHPKIFGGILARRSNENDLFQLQEYDIPEIDLVIVDLYPFEDTVASGASENEVIEKIDIGGITLIRAAAKNYRDVTIISSRDQYKSFIDILDTNNGCTSLEERKQFAMQAFNMSSHYDTAIFSYFCSNNIPPAFKQSVQHETTLRYGENPHQKGVFYGDLSGCFKQLHGKEVSYNNLLDIEAAVNLIGEFVEPTIAILKHNNACGLATRSELVQAWKDALAGDPVSAFGGVIVANRAIDSSTATEMDKLFFEVVIAPDFDEPALLTLKSKKNRIILKLNDFVAPSKQYRSMLNGVLVQDKDLNTESFDDMKPVTSSKPKDSELLDLVFANKIVKHSKSNAIVLAKNQQLIASGVGQTSRVDALKQAIEKAQSFKFDLQGAVMASDAFFPFADSVEMAAKVGVCAVVQPGGSVRDQETIDFCNNNGVAMVFTGVRHFKH